MIDFDEISKVDKAIEDFCQKNGIVYEISAKTADGDVLVKYTSSLDASDVSGYSGLIDEKIMELALKECDDDEG